MKIYRHTQHDSLLPNAMIGIFVILMVAGVFVFKPLFVVAPLVLLAGWMFRSLTIEIDAGKLRWRFGPGIIHKSVSLAEITAVEIVRTNFFEGWGIHWSRFGWLYNIAGFDAVAVTLRSGKQFALGTDDPDALAQIIQSNIASANFQA